MIAYIKGRLSMIMENEIIVENNGIGFNIMVPASLINEHPNTGSEVFIHTYMNVREDAMQLFGFLDRDDLMMFGKLITVNGVGPKGALGILSALSPDDLRFAILSEDVKAIAKAPGIGAKTASKLILELKDKVDLDEAFEKKLSNVQKREMKENGISSI
ncbi:MAG: Holliday junction branch migration protein RuvA, partial [Lachnospiraceae bacterium]|nr:Holliday junction branch migration protein RuvA [Lachnospiraceae bacterium]